MKLERINRKVRAEHGTVSTFRRDFFGYFGWPSICQTESGTLFVASSGLRNDHLCPFGRTVICASRDEGRSWTSPRVINDSPFDDRDAGIIKLGGENLLLAWFTSDIRLHSGSLPDTFQDKEKAARWRQGFSWMENLNVDEFCGSFVRVSDDGGATWGPQVRVPVSAPHGPILLKNGSILYLGKPFRTFAERQGHGGNIASIISKNGGKTWRECGTVPCFAGTSVKNYHEPHVVELPSGKLIGLIRFQNEGTVRGVEELGLVSFSLMQTESEDEGRTWTTPRPLGFHGSPPHIIRHSSGAIVCVYGYRMKPFGERAMVSRDEGKTWAYDYILRDDGPDGDLGYPASVELKDGSIFTVYYQKIKEPDERCSLLWTRWELE